MKKAIQTIKNSLTAGKEYPVVRESNGNTIIIDDSGFEVGYSERFLEAIEPITDSINPQLEGFFIPDNWKRLSA